MALQTYRAKRNFSVTPEPNPKSEKPREAGDLFVVQKHDARRLHYDFRLELDGVLKSWAVTRGPSLIPGEKRLAVAVEDHPLEYGSFEGTIPKGEYGGGAVLLWDRGTWKPIGDPHAGLAKGHLEFELKGQKLNGRWHLVRMHARPRDKHENWLLIKGDDEYARDDEAPDILEERPESVSTGRAIDEVARDESVQWKSGREETKANDGAEGNGGAAGKKARPPRSAVKPASLPGARKAPAPAVIEPMLATLTEKPPEGARWLHEVKLDGYRIMARIGAGRVRLMTRNGLDWTGKLGPEIAAALKALPVSEAAIDGELVVDVNGASNFSALQAALSEGRTERLTFTAFDLPYLDGYDLTGTPLIHRKEALRAVIGDGAGPVRFSDHFEESGELVLRHACRLGLEGVISKDRDSPYRAGRGRSWLKCKCSARQEFVIGGFTVSTASAKAIGSLALGVYDGRALRYVGRVGTGFSAAVAQSLHARLEAMRQPMSPFATRLTADQSRQLRYVRPELVAEVDFRAWTADGYLRHASFRALREDKPAEEIVREEPRSEAEPGGQRPAPALTHPDRLYWPDDGVTKEGLADYYAEVWSRMAPFVVERPLALLRCPDGVGGQQFFQKHAWKGLSDAIVLATDPAEPDKPLIAIRDFDGLTGLVQAGALEIHPWGSTLADWERPDTIVMDLDPGEDVSWQSMIEAAKDVRERLVAEGLAAFVKTSGGKGLHVAAPLKPEAGWPEVKAFTKRIADAMAADSPSRYVATIAKAKRKGKILVDYLRNQRGMTAVAAYSTRARPGAAVSMPIEWDELGPGIGPASFTVANAPARLASLARDPWADFRAAAAPIAASKGRRRKAAR